MKNEKEQSLIIAIVNKGNTDLVMEAARKAGARGGTIVVARGTGNEEIAKFYGIALQPEKEMVLIVVPLKIKDDVMNKIYEESGITTPGQGIVFSLPIIEALGLENNENKNEEE